MVTATGTSVFLILLTLLVRLEAKKIGVRSFIPPPDFAPKFQIDEFQDKVVLVTGGSSGIGYATALEFARHGAHVVIASRDRNPTWFNGDDAVKNINSDPEVIAAGGASRWVKTDVSNRTSVKALFADILRIDGRLDIAINNAGIAGPLGPINTVGDYLGTEYDPILTNLYGTIICLIEETQYFIDVNKSGIIVNVGSENGLVATPGGSLYGVSKFGISSLTRSVALEFLRGPPAIRVNAVAPGFTNTSLAWNQAKYAEDEQQVWEGEYVTPESALWEKWGPIFADSLRCGRLAEPSEEAAVILFLSSRAASYISGTVFSADMGDTA